jgi:hypothetical protein
VNAVLIQELFATALGVNKLASAQVSAFPHLANATSRAKLAAWTKLLMPVTAHQQSST